MPKLKLLFSFLLIVFLFNTISAQLKTEPYELLLLQERVQIVENIHSLSPDLYPVSKELIQGKFYRLIQFYKLPDIAQLEELKRSGVELLDYIPNKAYLTSLPANFDLAKLRDFNVRAISKWNKAWKTSFVVSEGNFDVWAREGDWLSLSVRYPKNITNTYALSVFQSKGLEIIKAPDFMNLIHLRISIKDLDWLLEHPMVNFVNQIPGEGIPESDRGKAMHRSNSLDASSQMGRHYDGTGISVLVRDDGALGPHIDFEGRLTEFSTDFDIDEDHGDGVAGIAVGAGNLDPDQRGMAAGATIYNKDYVADFLDNTLSLHFNEGVVLTNSSYSNGCNAGYTEITETVDRQVYQNPTLMHVFSAGNDGFSDCDYGAGERWGNITGGHKQGKNVIATGNLADNFLLQGSSSRGPAYDGRIKPDICAHGAGHVSTGPNNTYMSFGGTSAAAPGIMGVMAQLYQAYRELNGGEMPESSLIKGIMINSANDMLAPGPDFSSGWGYINALKAVKTLEEQRFFKDTIAPGIQKTHQIEVPANTTQVRFMLYWADPQASPAAGKSLINDLNLKGIDPAGMETLPWILDPTPNAATLGLSAIRGIDNLNNMEQVLIDDPVAGIHELVVEGFELPFGNHPYHIIYEFIQDEITLTYPNGGEGFIPGNEEIICWDAFETDEDFILDYSLNGGVDWTNLTTLPSTSHFYQWDVPEEHGNGEVLVRVSNGTYSDTNDEYFSIATPPTNVKIETVCPSYIRIGWDPVALAEGYDVFMLGDKFMDSIAHTTDNFYDFPVANPTESFWVAVRANGANQFLSQRTIAIKHTYVGFINCTVNNNLSAIGFQVSNRLQDCEIVEENLRVRIQNKGDMDQSNFDIYYQIDNEPTVSAVFTDTLQQGQVVNFEFPMPISFTQDGSYAIRSWVDLVDDEIRLDDTATTTINAVIYANPASLDLIEDFETNDFPPMDWKIRNGDNGITWIQGATTQLNGTPGGVALYRNPDNSSSNQKDELISFPVDLTNATYPALFFDRAYSLSPTGQPDRLQIEVHSDCGNQLEDIIYDSNVEGLQTTEQKVALWSPQNGEDWERAGFSLVEYIGKNILVKFVNTSRLGNNLYLDNINIAEYSSAPMASFTADPAVCVLELVSFKNNSEGIVETYQWDFGTGATPQTSTEKIPDPVFWSDAGMQEITLIVSNSFGVDTIKQQIEVEAMPTADFTTVNDEGIVTFTSIVTDVVSYHWDFGDGTTSTQMNPVHTYTNPGTYEVILTVESENCEPLSIMQTIEVDIDTNVEDLASGFSALIVPNPNDGRFVLQIEDFSARNIQVQLFDILGTNVFGETIQTANGHNTYALEMKELPSGIFFLNLKSDGLNKTLRLMIE